MTMRKPFYTTDFAQIEETTIENPMSDRDFKEEDDFSDLTTRSSGRIPFGKTAIGAFVTLFFLSIAVWVIKLIEKLFNHSQLLGWFASFVTVVGVIALVGFSISEILAFRRLARVDFIRSQASNALADDSISEARGVVANLVQFTSDQPLTAAGRNSIKQLENDIIDGRALIHLAEAEILASLDQHARLFILDAAKRVSVVTAVSPRALIDLTYVFYESIRLIKKIAFLYGARPGRLGILSLIKRVFAHLAVTGSLAFGDGVLQQILGQGLAARLSTRLGEGVINGLLTTRIGIAAMDALRPLPFDGQKRPTIGDFTTDLIGLNSKKQNRKNRSIETNIATER